MSTIARFLGARGSIEKESPAARCWAACFLVDRCELSTVLGKARQTVTNRRIQNGHHERLGRHIPCAPQTVSRGRLEPKSRVELGMPDDDDERTPLSPKAFDASFHELAADAFPLMGREHRHRPERSTHDCPHGQRTEHHVAHDEAVSNRDQGQQGPAVGAKRIDDATFQLLIEGLSIHLANRCEIARLLVSDLDHVVPGLSAEQVPE